MTGHLRASIVQKVSLPVILIAGVFVLMMAVSGGSTHAQTGDTPQTGPVFTVNTTAHPGDGVCTTANCTLMEAVTTANITPNGPQPDQIHFNIAGCPNGICTIVSPQGFAISDAVIIDGLTQPGLDGVCPLTAHQPLRIELRGSNGSAIAMRASQITIRGLVMNTARENTVSSLNSQDSTIECNYIGTDPTGMMEFGADYIGISLRNSPRSRILNNLVSGFYGYGIGISNSSDSLIQGNRIGTNLAGNAAIGNGTGLILETSQNVVITQNLFSGNVAALFIATTNTTITANLIGVAADGVSPLGNRWGIMLRYEGGHRIGGENPSDANVIRHNQEYAISAFDGAVGNRLLGNSISDNGVLGIDLRIQYGDPLNSVNLNDDDNLDPGLMGNRGQNFPVITSVTTSQINFSLNSRPNRTYRIEFFANADCSLSGYGQGEVFLGATNVSTDTAGVVAGSFTYAAVSGRSVITATATDPEGNTSEFSRCFVVNVGTPTAAAPTATSIPATPTLVLPTPTDTGAFTCERIRVRLNQLGYSSAGFKITNTNTAPTTLRRMTINWQPFPGYPNTAVVSISSGGGPPIWYANPLDTAPPTDIGEAGVVTSDGNYTFGQLFPIEGNRVPTARADLVIVTFQNVPNDLENTYNTGMFDNSVFVFDHPTAVTDCVVYSESPLGIIPVTLSDAQVGTFYTQTFTIQRPTSTFGDDDGHAGIIRTFVVTQGGLPPGLTLTLEGVLSGTPTTMGSYSFTLRASGGASGIRTYTLNVIPPAGLTQTPLPLTMTPTVTPLPLPLALTTLSLPNGAVGVTYSQTISAMGGQPPYTFSVQRGVPPAGLTLSTTGVLSGIPAQHGGAMFTLQVMDATGAVASQMYSLVINPSAIPSLTLTPSSLPVAYVNAGYQAVIGAQGGSGLYTYIVTGGMLPSGMMMDGATGLISGVPTTEGSYTFTVQAFDNAGATGTATFTLTVAPPDTLSGN